MLNVLGLSHAAFDVPEEGFQQVRQVGPALKGVRWQIGGGRVWASVCDPGYEGRIQ